MVKARTEIQGHSTVAVEAREGALVKGGVKGGVEEGAEEAGFAAEEVEEAA